MKSIFLICSILFTAIAFAQETSENQPATTDTNHMTDNQWKERLSEEQYRILRECGTEPAFSGKYYNHKEDGTYHCAGCNAQLFSSDTKYESGSGWPSFYDAIDKDAIKEELDTSFGMRRIEIKCAQCDGHLGHVFEDGPRPTGLRYCVNSGALDFEAKSSE